MRDTNLIADIKRRPGLYLGTLSIYTLKAFLDGYRLGKGENETGLLLDEFQVFIANKYNVSANVGWDAIIRLYSSSDFHAFNAFFELFEQFLAPAGTTSSQNPPR